MTRKALNLQELNVESFETTAAIAAVALTTGESWSEDSICPTVTPTRPPLY